MWFEVRVCLENLSEKVIAIVDVEPSPKPFCVCPDFSWTNAPEYDFF